MKERLEYIDRLKGFAIFLVVFGHVIQNNTLDSTMNPLFEIIYSFHMPFFFFLSGYIADKTTRIETVYGYWKFLKKKITSLFIPFLVWPMIIDGIIFKHHFNFSTDSVLELFLHPNLWFLLSLLKIMFIYSLFHVLSKFANIKKRIILDLLLFALLILPILFWGIKTSNFNLILFILHTSLFFFGVLLSKYTFIRSFVINKWVFLSAVIIFCSMVGFYHSDVAPTLLLKGLKVILVFFLSLSASIALYDLAQRLILPVWMERFLTKMGGASIVIYVTPIEILSKSIVFPQEASIALVALLASIISIIEMYLRFWFSKIVECIPLLNLALYGKTQNRI